ncbi:MAG: methionine--tRNA ligase subunit beta [Candidatus Aenigmatarchaeota archaeon]|nr:MAG: methionine--tRNA ligase subunit beta [Candidatus Aenigmarchaeota archaeon]RLJ09389.1 MAG: methionine--tRNA ligase subunit beta [Candidatus Aenigmarchaeota archaeon]
MVTIKDFEKLEIKIGEILSVEEVPDSDKLYVLQVDVGGKQIQLVAGLKNYYQQSELVGKKIVVLSNLEPAVIRGVASEGMLLAAIDENTVSLLTPDKEVSVGSKVA